MKKIINLLSESELIMFAPTYFRDDNCEYLLVTVGKKSERVYGEKSWETTKIEKWYKRGRNHFRCYKRNSFGQFVIYNDNFLDTSQFKDVMKATVIVEGDRWYVWFSGLVDDNWKIYFCQRDKLGWGRIQEIQVTNTGHMCEHIYLPCVIKDREFRMWYVCRDCNNRRIFHAVSRDGVVWKDSKMVMDIGEEGEGDRYAVDCPDVFFVDDKYIMLYGGGTSRGIHLALSKDGYTWDKKGLVIPRGRSREYNYNYSFYPSILSVKRKACGKESIGVVFAGEDINNNWCILYTEDIDYNVNNNTIMLNKQEVQNICDLISNIPEYFLSEQNDCNCKDKFYESADVKQLRPSSGPVFLLKKKGIVVKVLRDRVKAENEYMARISFCGKLNLVPVQIYYFLDKIIILMPYVENAISLSEVSRLKSAIFPQMCLLFFEECIEVIKENSTNYSETIIEYTGQTLEVLKNWGMELKEFCKKILITSRANEKRYNLQEEYNDAIKFISLKPQKCSYFSGDVNFRNVLYKEDKLYYIDFEYLGYFDVDYLMAKQIGSLFKHCKIFDYTECFGVEKGKIIGYEFTKEMKVVIEGLKYILTEEDAFDCRRIRAYIMVKFYFRLRESFFDLDTILAKEQLSRYIAMLDFFEEVIYD